MKTLRRYITVVILLLVASMSAFAQDYDDVEESEDNYGPPPKRGYRYSFMWEAHAPHIVMNEANRLAWKGIVGTSFKFNVQVAKNFSIGAFVRGVAFTIYNPTVYYDTLYNNPFHTTFTGGVNFMYEVRMGEQFAFIPELNVGYSWIRYYDLDKQFNGQRQLDRFGVNINFNAGFYYYVRSNKRLGIGMILGANYFSHRFKLSETGVHMGNNELYEANDKGPTIHLNIGFGIITKFTKIRD